jgi:L,D-transpeptidase ErfK/SrfK
MRYIVFSLSLLVSLAYSSAYSLIFSLPKPGDSVVGNIQFVNSAAGDSLSSLGIDYDVGRDLISQVNQDYDVDETLPVNTIVVIPSRFILPDYPHIGIVVNLAEMRLYYYPPGTNTVMIYPIGIGKQGRMTPLGMTSISAKKKDPTWTPPQSIRDFNKAQGIILPKVIQGGADNPLGRRALYLAVPGAYRIHASNFPESIGSRGSFGCLRMMEADIEQLFPFIAKNTPVLIVDEPYKVGWNEGQLYVEVHQPLDENLLHVKKILLPVTRSLLRLSVAHHVEINWDNVQLAFDNATGVPEAVSDVSDNNNGMDDSRFFAVPAQTVWPAHTTLCRMTHHCIQENSADPEVW